MQPQGWAKWSQPEQWLLADGCLRYHCNAASVDGVPSSITRGNMKTKENTAPKQALGITDTTSSFASLCKTHREKGFCGLSPASSTFQLIEELAPGLSVDRKCSWFADRLCLRHPGLPSVHMGSLSSLATERSLFSPDPLSSHLTLNPLRGLGMAHAGPWPRQPPPPPPLTPKVH